MGATAIDDTDRLGWLEQALRPQNGPVTLTYATATGCRCLSCFMYVVSWEDRHDGLRSVEAETLREAIDLARREMGPR